MIDIHYKDNLKIICWPTYNNYTIISSHFHICYWPSFNVLDIYSKKPNARYASSDARLLLKIKNQNLTFFGKEKLPDEDGKINIVFYTGEQVDQKIQHYLNLKAFL